jgi:hypothetical protein
LVKEPKPKSAKKVIIKEDVPKGATNARLEAMKARILQNQMNKDIKPKEEIIPVKNPEPELKEKILK